MVKRFNITGTIRDKEYDITQGTPGSELLYMTANKNSEAEKITVFLSNLANARIKQFDYDFATLAVKGRASQGNLLTRYPVRKVELKEKGKSTAGGRKIWYEPGVGRLNGDGHGQFIGEFDGDDRILVVWNDGNYELTSYEFTNRYEADKVYLLQKFYQEQPISAIYLNASSKQHFAKRFIIETLSVEKKFGFIGEEPGNKLIVCSTAAEAEVELKWTDPKEGKLNEKLNLAEYCEIRGWKAQGTRLNKTKITAIELLSPRVEEFKQANETVVEQMQQEKDAGDNGGGQLNLL